MSKIAKIANLSQKQFPKLFFWRFASSARWVELGLPLISPQISLTLFSTGVKEARKKSKKKCKSFFYIKLKWIAFNHFLASLQTKNIENFHNVQFSGLFSQSIQGQTMYILDPNFHFSGSPWIPAEKPIINPDPGRNGGREQGAHLQLPKQMRTLAAGLPRILMGTQKKWILMGTQNGVLHSHVNRFPLA